MGEIYASAAHQTTMGHPCLAGNSNQQQQQAGSNKRLRADPLWLEEHDYCLSPGPKFRPVQYFSKLPDYLVQLKLDFREADDMDTEDCCSSSSDSETCWASPASSGSSSTLSCSPNSSPSITLSEGKKEESSNTAKTNSTNLPVQERKVLFVGKLPDNTTEDYLHRRFHKFGTIEKVSIYFRKNADNYGFVTFQDSRSTYDAYQNGNNDPNEPKVDLCFGERRKFCSRKYMDLDAVSAGPMREAPAESLDFDCLLKQAVKSKSTTPVRRPSSFVW